MMTVDHENCCGCNACVQACPANTIHMVPDENQFIYPVIDTDLCVNCGLCDNICGYKHIDPSRKPQEVYVGVAGNRKMLEKSASGGIFAALAERVLDDGGVVYGAVMERCNGRFEIYHTGIEDRRELERLQGSKYVQSNIRDSFKKIRADLKAGRKVLFCGVPCQCAGLRTFLRKDYDKLFIVDIICHGVPSEKMFNDFIDYRFGNNIIDFKFRDKSRGWGLTGKAVMEDGRSIPVPSGTSSYYSLFLDAQIYRDNCYNCKYANPHRVGDITIGDFWGVKYEHPELMDKIDPHRGVSCVIVNNAKGAEFLGTVKDSIDLYPSAYDKVARRNKQLYAPSVKGKYHDTIMAQYRESGYAAVDRFFKTHYRKQRLVHSIMAIMPTGVLSAIRTLLHK